MLNWRALKKFRPTHQQMLLASFATVFVVILLIAAAFEVRQTAKAKVVSAVTRLEKKIGMPITIKRWQLGLGEVTFDDVAIGDAGDAVISRIEVEVNLMPWSDEFGELRTITVDKIRIKHKLASSFDSNSDEDDEGDDSASSDGSDGSNINDKRGMPLRDRIVAELATLTPERRVELSASLTQLVEKIFTALPAKQLVIRSAGAALYPLNASNQDEPILEFQGLSLFVQKSNRSVRFKIKEIKTVSGFSESNLDGKLRFATAKKADYGFLLKKRSPEKAISDWAFAGNFDTNFESARLKFQIHTLPTSIAAQFAPYLAAGNEAGLGIQGEITATKDQLAKSETWDITAKGGSTGMTVTVPFLSANPIGPVLANMEATAQFRPKDKSIVLQELVVSLPPQHEKDVATPKTTNSPLAFHITANGRLDGNATKPVEGLVLQGHISLPETNCQTILSSTPKGFAPNLGGFTMDGDAHITLDFRLDTNKLESLAVNLRDANFGCRVLQAPYAFTEEHLDGPLTLQRQVSKNDEPMTLSIASDSPDFTPLAAIARSVDLAFTSSEDAGFWYHKGIDLPALESAVRRNAAEKRVAVGGSTITMQTVKNLFLTPDRTVSRKIQELFLAWHLEHVIRKERILELYLNIAELGPGIYGITHAASHFFGKRPADLNLLESAYLASLLPSPKSRYRYFCNGQLTPNFKDMVDGLLRRMLALRRIDAERYSAAISESLQFNEQARRASSACIKQPGDEERDPDPS